MGIDDNSISAKLNLCVRVTPWEGQLFGLFMSERYALRRCVTQLSQKRHGTVTVSGYDETMQKYRMPCRCGREGNLPVKSVLVIEDEMDILDLVEYHLVQAGFTVLKAPDGESGLELARTKKPTLIILDIMLPKMDGKEVCRALKSSPATEWIPVMMLTAKAEEVDRIVGFELGADDYVTKPFSPRELVLRVKAILRKRESEGARGKSIERGDLWIDIDRHHVSINKRARHAHIDRVQTPC